MNKLQFSDKNGNIWNPVITTPTLIRACRLYRVDITTLTEGKLNLGDMIDLIWLACEHQAKSNGVKDREAFFEVLPLALLKDAMVAVISSFAESFPEAAPMLGGLGIGPNVPLEDGLSKTL